jgi:glyoxylase-like metal-dependent hydrolase (beta-lactamase superfamily II)
MRGNTLAAVALLLCLLAGLANAEQLSPNLTVEYGAVNSVIVGTGESAVAIYAVPQSHRSFVSKVLLTHHRRDVVTAAIPAIQKAAKAIAPESERALFETPSKWWGEFWTKRFHDYSQQSTKVLTATLPVAQWVKEGDHLQLGEIAFDVLETPGFTRGAVSYIANVDGRKIAFTGDLIYGDGKLFDLYSFQDAIPEAKIGGYHGHASRLAMLIPSLRKIGSIRVYCG